jgi:5-methylcytosine-specific restriction protein A
LLPRGQARCDAHQLGYERPTSAERGYGHQWRKLRARILARDPICTECGRAPSNTVDHVRARTAGGTDDEANLRGVCARCHNSKTAAVDGAYGNPLRGVGG